MAPTFDPGFSTSEMTVVFSAESTVAAILEYEAALALALGDVGSAPADEAAAVAAACVEPLAKPEEILASTWEVGTPIIAVVAAIRSRLDDESHRGWVHFGSTSQDALDTGRMLQARQALGLLESSLVAVSRHLHTLVVEHRDQPQMGRTFLQDSRPTTFGARAAGWLSPTLQNLVELRRRREQLAVQVGGPSGSLVELGPAASEFIEALAGRLGLKAPPVSWHTDRSPIWALARSVEATSQSMSKIATDLALLAQSSVAEVGVRAGGSSSMPEKRNPIDPVRVVAAASACHGFASMLTGARTGELDRGIGGWHTEWLALPMLFHTAAAAAEATGTCLGSLEVDGEKMSAGVDASGGHLENADPRLIDGVLARFDEVVGAG